MITVGGYQYTADDLRGTVAAFAQSWRDTADRRDPGIAVAFGRRLAVVVASHLGEPAPAPGEDPGPHLDRLARSVWRHFGGDLSDPPTRRRAAALLGDGLEVIDEFGTALRAAGEMPDSAEGRVVRLGRSDGGVPKAAVAEAEAGLGGVVGDRQATRRHHGRPPQALCLWSAEVIDALAADGHPIGYGAAGENVTISGLDWDEVRPGVRLLIGGVLAEASWYADPCRQNARWFSDGDFMRISSERGPVSRVYAWVRRPGTMRTGDLVVLEP